MRLPILVNDTDIDIPLRTLPVVTKLLLLTGVHLCNERIRSQKPLRRSSWII